jgi:HD-GYP domain-containing protein (c-di-GMP phosphodiesterase class II)
MLMEGVNDSTVTVVERLADLTSTESRHDVTRIVMLVAFLLLLTMVMVFVTDGTRQAFLHTVYLPIIVASLGLGIAGGAVTALVGGLLILGPLMPLSVASKIDQSILNVIFRTAILVLVAVVTGGFANDLRRRRAALELTQVRIQELHGRNLRLFARLVSERDQETAGHCERVAHNCVVVGRRLGLSDHELRQLYWSGMLHDLGKISVPEAILHKPGKLTDDEFEIIKMHAVHGAEFILSVSEDFEQLAEAVRSHHERWDGAGYPDGLKGTQIPLAARILAVADVFEAVTSVRPYREPMKFHEACQLIREGAGTHFDPAIVEVFLSEESADNILHHGEPEPIYDRFVVEILHDSTDKTGAVAVK